MLSNILMFLVGFGIVGVFYGISRFKRGNKEMDQERLRSKR